MKTLTALLIDLTTLRRSRVEIFPLTQNLLRSVDVLLRLKEGRFGFLAINTHVFEAHLSWLQWSPPSASTELAEVNVPLRPTQAAAD